MRRRAAREYPETLEGLYRWLGDTRYFDGVPQLMGLVRAHGGTMPLAHLDDMTDHELLQYSRVGKTSLAKIRQGIVAFRQARATHTHTEKEAPMPMVRFAEDTKAINTETITSWEDDGTTLTVAFQGGETKTYTDAERTALLNNRDFLGGRPRLD